MSEPSAKQAKLSDECSPKEVTFPENLSVSFPWVSFRNISKPARTYKLHETIGLVPSMEAAPIVSVDELAKQDTSAGQQVVAKLNKQLEGQNVWKDEPWKAFVVLQEVQAACGVDDDDSIETIIQKLFDIPAEEGKRGDIQVEARPALHSRKAFFSQHNYFSYGQVDTKRLAKLKTITNSIKSATVKNSCSIIKFHEPYTSVYHWGIFIVGRMKKLHGALLVTVVTDGSEEHYHHGK
eukprot:m.11180 g.11180  ORF g.11180 m.11180 type:complete len:237 (+) comp9755_c0_seq1:83-793(+)